ncbi:acetyl-CoA carboxylase biotin carboxylase subunit [soil metagenome]
MTTLPARPFSTLLVANRGEIAVRVIRAARERGLRTVAVFSDADADALHVEQADEAVRIGPTPAAQSYLSVEALLRAAAQTGAEAVHPGYGFLSERADFARAVTEAGLVWVGPPADVIEQMGRKDRARTVAVAAGLPVVPSHPLPKLSPPQCVRTQPGGDNFAGGELAGGGKLTYPVLVKAAAGGGGKGMRVVREPAELDAAIDAAGREARHAFGDDTLLLERFVEAGRHVEVQVMADTHGRVLHLYERDCSVQRRHQKVLEEAPAPTISPDLRERLCASATALTREAVYFGPGTVEFLVAGEEFFFLEMNTRLQVEHPVTEAVTGLDLVRLQLQVAAGEPLPLSQADVRARGHAIEARIYAEDPYAGFLPQAGRVGRVEWPVEHARVDAALRAGEEVSTAYDPMLGKVIVHAPTRPEALTALTAALDRTVVTGVATNVGFVRALVAGPEYAEARIHTAWLDTDPSARAYLQRPELPAAAWSHAARHLLAERPAAETSHPFGAADGWRGAGEPAPPRVLLRAGGRTRFVAGAADDVQALTVHVSAGAVEVVHEGYVHLLERPDALGAAGQHPTASDRDVTAPMPGTVLAVHVSEGDRVEPGAALGVLEAMKMELTLTAPSAGEVAWVGAVAGDRVPIGQVLFTVEPVEPGGAVEPAETVEPAEPGGAD